MRNIFSIGMIKQKKEKLTMKKFQLNKQKLNLNKLTTPLLALSLVLGLALNLSLSGRVSAASVTTTDYPISTESGGLGFTDGISTDYPLNLTSLEPGGSFWKVGPDSNYSSPGGRRFETFNFSNLESCNQTSNIDAINYKFSIKIIGSSSVNDKSWILLYNPSDSNNPIVEMTELPASNASSNFVQYDFNFPVLPTTFANINDYKIAIMYDNLDTTASRMEFDVDEISRTLTYDDSSCPSTNTTPTITSPSTVTIPSTTTSGSTVVPGSSLAATDTDGDTLTYSITAGNGGGYFAIDPTTGDITTTSTNIPAGTYTITVQVDDGNGGVTSAVVTITVGAGGVATSSTTLPKTGDSQTQVLVLATLVSLAGVMALKTRAKLAPNNR
jgi:LPXTG-motif cell wall-anchored protein